MVGWEGSDAVSLPRDGAAWTLRNSAIILEGLRALQVSLLILKLKYIYIVHSFSQSNTVIVAIPSFNNCCISLHVFDLICACILL